ncbi:MAG: DNA repair protein RecN [Flavobacteriaceae bacterium]|nr:DNA repair protein RecN [Flavobacteriaceae bacterium]
MLTQLYIKNYALIEELNIQFHDGLSIITGETGAGKSIILGALGLVLGNRADSTSLKDSSQKCIIEARFSIKNYGLKDFFHQNDLDFEEESILRREILPSGKSRAFVNDTPVTLPVINTLKKYLIDIHSQNQTLQLSDNSYQFYVLDSFVKNEKLLHKYATELKHYKKLQKELEEIERKQREVHQQYDYNLHLYNELEEAQLEVGEQEELEIKLDKLNNVEDIKRQLSESIHLSSDDEIGIQNLLYTLENSMSKISSFSNAYSELLNRISSLKIEFDDIFAELENENESIDFDPIELERSNDRLQLIFQLQKKHYVNSIEELLQVYDELGAKIATVENADAIINEKRAAIESSEKVLVNLADKISDQRKKGIPVLINQLEKLVGGLGMESARFKLELSPVDQFLSHGRDALSFQVSTNKGANYGELKKVASGGELSRIMLSVKRILSEKINLPTIIFDEIDTGVSGEISNKIAAIMQDMSTKMQVLAITHLPQIAAKGKQHYKVFKEDHQQQTLTNITRLTDDERIVEIAEMLSGKKVSDSALSHAKDLLN